MDGSSKNDQVKPELEELRKHLMSDPSTEELQAMKLKIDVLEGMSRLSGDEKHDHDTDHENDHDHQHTN